MLVEFFAAGATDYFGQVFTFGEDGDPSQGTGIVYSFAADRRGGFDNDDTALMMATLPALSLAMKAHAGHIIASALLRTYLGEQTGGRVHAGAIERGSVENINAVLWYADIRGFTPTSDSSPGPVIIDLLTACSKPSPRRYARVAARCLNFLATACWRPSRLRKRSRGNLPPCARRRGGSNAGLAALNQTRAAAGLPAVSVDLALHVGEVLYGNVGAADRLDFTVIGPAVNEVARIEALCEPLDRPVLISAEFAAAVDDADHRLVSLGRYNLRGVREAKEIFALAPN